MKELQKKALKLLSSGKYDRIDYEIDPYGNKRLSAVSSNGKKPYNFYKKAKSNAKPGNAQYIGSFRRIPVKFSTVEKKRNRR